MIMKQKLMFYKIQLKILNLKLMFLKHLLILQNTIEDLKSEVNVVKASIDSYVTAANDNETKINGLQNTIEDLKSEMNVLKASIETQVNADGDKDSTNEIQDLSIDGSTLKISKGGTSVTLKIENIVGLGAKLCSGCDTPMCTS
eukprot:459552_1